MTSLHFELSTINTYALVFCRFGGMIFFNPLLSRRNIPSQFKIALVLGLCILVTPSVPYSAAAHTEHTFVLVFAMIEELLMGIAFGFIMQMFYYLLFTTGEVIDMGFGLSMSKAFDPGSNLQISASGKLFQLFFVCYFFATDSHLLLIRIMASSYQVFAPGAVQVGAHAGEFLSTLFVTTFSLVLHLALPYLAASFVLEMAMGILMKLIPQINVFSIHFQMKILLGLVLLFAFAEPMASFINDYTETMLLQTQELFSYVG